MHANPSQFLPTCALLALALFVPLRSQAASILLSETENPDSARSVKLPFDYGIDVQFRYSNWTDGANKGIGIGFFDPAAMPTTAGGEVDTTDLSRAFLAIAIDRSGNYVGSEKEGGDGKYVSELMKSFASPGDVTSKDDSEAKVYSDTQSVKVEDGGGDGKAGDGSSEEKKTSYRKAEIEVDSSRLSERTLPVTVWITTEDGNRSVVAKYDAYKQLLDYCGGDERKIPDSLSLALSGSTASVSSVQVTSVQNAPGFSTTETPEPASLGSALLGMVLVGIIGRRRQRNQGSAE